MPFAIFWACAVASVTLTQAASKAVCSCSTQHQAISKHCAAGLACFYAHGRDELRAEAAALLGNVDADYNFQLCENWYTKGRCPNGDRCHFAHGLNEVRCVLSKTLFDTICSRFTFTPQSGLHTMVSQQPPCVGKSLLSLSI